MKPAKNAIKTIVTFDPIMQFLFLFAFDTCKIYFMRKVSKSNHLNVIGNNSETYVFMWNVGLCVISSTSPLQAA